VSKQAFYMGWTSIAEALLAQMGCSMWLVRV